MLSLLFALLAGIGGLHPDSQSSSSIVISGSGGGLELRCQTLSVLECVEVDLDRDQRLSADELERGGDAIAQYLERRYRVEPLAATGPWRLELDESSTSGQQHLLARRTLTLPVDAEGFTVRCTLFLEQNPLHRDVATVRWNDDDPALFVFGEGVETWRFESASARRSGVVASYFGLGVDHILSGYDHLAFLLALIVAARSLRSLVAVVTAFTASHSVTLGCAALGLVRAPGLLVELAIALSIAYVGAETLAVRKPGSRWLEAFGFGLVHGLGFAGFLGESLVFEPLKLSALVGFNLGVEAGQLAVVLALYLLLRWCPGDRSHEGEARAWLAPRPVRLGASAVVTACGLWWFLERAGWLPWAA